MVGMVEQGLKGLVGVLLECLRIKFAFLGRLIGVVGAPDFRNGCRVLEEGEGKTHNWTRTRTDERGKF